LSTRLRRRKGQNGKEKQDCWTTTNHTAVPTSDADQRLMSVDTPFEMSAALTDVHFTEA
jgi:hypothetical protein